MNTSTDHNTTADNSVDASADLAPSVIEQAEQEADAFISKVQSLADEGNGLRPETLRVVARRLGASANKFGRPEMVRFTAFVLAMSARNLSLNARIQLAQTANKAAFLASKPVFRVAAKASEVEGTLSYKLNMPATFEATVS